MTMDGGGGETGGDVRVSTVGCIERARARATGVVPLNRCDFLGEIERRSAASSDLDSCGVNPSIKNLSGLFAHSSSN